MDTPDHKVNPVCSRRWKQEAVFKGQSGQDYTRYFEMIILGYKNQNNMVGIDRSKNPKEGRQMSFQKEAVEASVQVMVLVWSCKLGFLHPVPPSFGYLFVCLELN